MGFSMVTIQCPREQQHASIDMLAFTNTQRSGKVTRAVSIITTNPFGVLRVDIPTLLSRPIDNSFCHCVSFKYRVWIIFC